MEPVQFVTIDNQGYLTMKFVLSNGEFDSAPSDDVPIWQSGTMDLAASTFALGSRVWPVVKHLLGTSTATSAVSMAFNGRTAVYKAIGKNVQLMEIIEAGSAALQSPPGWPAGIPITRLPFSNWDRTVKAASVWTCAPASADDAVKACNWAATNGYSVRPSGIRHNWSPLTIADGLAGDAKVLLMNTTAAFTGMSFSKSGAAGPRVKVGTGVTMGDLLSFLESQPGGGSVGPGTGWSFPNTPGPDHITVGGVIAINGHGTSVPNPLEGWDISYGSMSNRILELTAIVSDPAKPSAEKPYSLKVFKRSDPDAKAFFTQLGRSMVVDVTLAVIPNYNLRCQSFMDIPWKTLFAAPAKDGSNPPNSYAALMEQSGRVEAIWFPFSEFPWQKVWSNCPSKPATSRQVNEPNNYAFSDNLPDGVTALMHHVTDGLPWLTPALGKAMELATIFGLDANNPEKQTADIWGASKNLLFYVKDTTLRITANGYAVLMKRKDVQKGVSLFAKQFDAMLEKYKKANKYPINAPIEVRVTSLDSPIAQRPVISAIGADAVTEANGWDVALWLDVTTIPGTPHADEFYAELEAWILATYNAFGRVVPEWSKGWAFTADQGAWTDKAFMKYTAQAFTTNRKPGDDWAWAVATWAKYDSKGLFFTELTQELFG